MEKKIVIQPNLYFDSATLMALAQKAKRMDSISEAVAVMATNANKELLDNVNLLNDNVVNATPRDLILAVAGDSREAVMKAMDYLKDGLSGKKIKSNAKAVEVPNNLLQALEHEPELNFAVISVPGQYAAYEARKALEAGLHVMLFSDNVSQEQEIELKKLAEAKGLLMMGPDCGTAIISGAPLAFANVVRPGRIGIVAAAGTGLQEIFCLIANWGGGISQAIGAGGRDVNEVVGGIQFLQGLRALLDDPSTEVIVLTGKPPAASVEKKILKLAATAKKPIIVNLLGGNPEQVRAAGCIFAANLEEAARLAVENTGITVRQVGFTPELVEEAVQGMAPEQKWIRGLFTGGTLCYEALLALGRQIGNVYSNTPISKELALRDNRLSFEHTALDLGDDEFTKGRPHPMIEPTIRVERIAAEAQDPEVAVLLLDVVLGYGTHREPVDVMADQVRKAMTVVEGRGGKLVVVASVTGTDADPQNRQTQVDKLRELGVYVLPSNYQAVQFAAAVIKKRGRD